MTINQNRFFTTEEYIIKNVKTIISIVTIMKKSLSSLMLAVAIILCATTTILAQKTDKELRKDLKSKAVKDARKESKKFEKEGWKVAPGALPMDKQIENAWMKQYQEDEEGYPAYLVASGSSVANSQGAAKLQATELAKLELAGLLSTRISALIENSVANNQLDREDAASVTKTVAASKNIIAQELGRVLVLFEIYREVGKKNIETQVRLAYNFEMAKAAAKKVLKDQLLKETEVTHEKLEKLMNW